MSNSKAWLEAAGVTGIIIGNNNDGTLYYCVDTRWGRGTVTSREAGDKPDASDSLRSALRNRINAVSTVLATLTEAP